MEGLRLEHIPDILVDRGRYEDILYTPLTEAYRELERRRRDADLERRISDFLDGDIPAPLRSGPRAVICRSVISPNFEVRRFTQLTETFGKIEPLYWEYTADKFTSNNELKRMLGKLYFLNGIGKNHGPKVGVLSVLDVAASDGKPFSALRTRWGQNFIRFHHELFDARHRKASNHFFDSSEWLKTRGGNAEAYYRSFLLLFVRHAILFENVLLNKQEIGFTTRVFFPTFLSIYRDIGLKPLIVTLQPTRVEMSPFWMYYPGSDMNYVRNMMNNGTV